ncbi:hypothetical protein [Pseudooctadecabacter jejudonensis]|uniref:Uncharacterized protein n=1 Tax=Pseudooctadecabacter jejudonensis TaxID=1391910 RepID=A0A1Y5RLM4_9RHOB|nr:hypothetical protein [Pseudooctadecabacter jejudonensis]SLN20370.1 hypothetical protein PSJ8397_00754 [Pseudooctadecabacter jejudonensis]
MRRHIFIASLAAAFLGLTQAQADTVMLTSVEDVPFASAAASSPTSRTNSLVTVFDAEALIVLDAERSRLFELADANRTARRSFGVDVSSLVGLTPMTPFN